MRWALGITAGVGLMLLIYAAWPVVGLYQIASGVEVRDATQVAERVDFPAVRRSLTRQIVASYRELTGKNKRPRPLMTGLGYRLAISVADPVVARIVTARALLDLLGEGRIKAPAGGDRRAATIRAGLPPMKAPSPGVLWRAWLDSSYSGRNFYVYLPPDTPRGDQFRVQLRLVNWRWMLTGIELPEPVSLRLAQEIVEARKAAN